MPPARLKKKKPHKARRRRNLSTVVGLPKREKVIREGGNRKVVYVKTRDYDRTKFRGKKIWVSGRRKGKLFVAR